MIYNLPQFLDTEDKIVGPFTAKQMGWMFGAGAIILFLWSVLEPTYFYILCVPIVLLTAALAFYHPNGQPLINFIISMILYLFREKTFLWRRIPNLKHPIKKAPAKQKGGIILKKLDASQIHDLTEILDKK